MSLQIQKHAYVTTIRFECDYSHASGNVHGEFRAVPGKCGLSLSITADSGLQVVKEARQLGWAIDYSSKKCRCPKHRMRK